MIRLTSITCVLGLVLLFCVNAGAQRDPEAEEFQLLRQEIEKLLAGQQRLQKELSDIKGLLTKGARRPPPPKFEPTVVELSNDPIKGKLDARLTLLDFTDYE